MPAHYILNANGEPERCDDMRKWHEWMEQTWGPRYIAREKIGSSEVATRLTGSDLSSGEGPPILFRTTIRRGKHDKYSEYYSTREDALAGHAIMLQIVHSG